MIRSGNTELKKKTDAFLCVYLQVFSVSWSSANKKIVAVKKRDFFFFHLVSKEILKTVTSHLRWCVLCLIFFCYCFTSCYFLCNSPLVSDTHFLPVWVSHLCDCLPRPDVFHLCPLIPASLVYLVCALLVLCFSLSLLLVSSISAFSWC